LWVIWERDEGRVVESERNEIEEGLEGISNIRTVGVRSCLFRNRGEEGDDDER
jgi:hypothetical protein